MPLGRAAAGVPLGSELPAGAGGGAVAGQDPGRLVGGVYAANTIGAIAGALVFSLLLIPAIGTAGAERVLIGLAAAAALVALFPVLRQRRAAVRAGVAAALAVATGVAAFLALSVTPIPWTTVAFGRRRPALARNRPPASSKTFPTGPANRTSTAPTSARGRMSRSPSP